MAAADEAIKSGNQVKLTDFRDSLSSKGHCDNKIIVTSVLRTDADVERLMKYNSSPLSLQFLFNPERTARFKPTNNEYH